MITIRLPDFWVQKLVKMPETGMGYQKVDITLKDHRVLENLTVLNAEECEAFDEFDPRQIVDIKLHK